MPNCIKCDGNGFQVLQGSKWPCDRCQDGVFPELKLQLRELYNLCAGTKHTLRSSKPKVSREGSGFYTQALNRRAYYVWRMARYHGGQDLTHPDLAVKEIEGDPCIGDLNIVANWFAKETFGTCLAALERRQRMLSGRR